LGEARSEIFFKFKQDWTDGIELIPQHIFLHAPTPVAFGKTMPKNHAHAAMEAVN
jgi:hypothetical protein